MFMVQQESTATLIIPLLYSTDWVHAADSAADTVWYIKGKI